MDCTPLSALRVGSERQCIRVRASRVCPNRAGFGDGEVKDIRMVLIDEKGDSIYAVIPNNLAAQNSHVLHETAVYKLGLFEASANIEDMNPVDNPLVIMFTPLTTVDLVLQPDDVFPEWTYRLTSFADLPEPSEFPKRFIDVIGVIRGISSVATLNQPRRNVPTSRRHIVLADGSGSEIRVTLWGEAALRFNGQTLRFLGAEKSAVVIFVGTTVHTYEGSLVSWNRYCPLYIGSRELAGAAACRWYINEDIEDINILRASIQSSFQPIAHLPAPRQLNLRTLVNAQYPTRPLSMLLNHDFLQNQNGMSRCIVRVWRITPGQQWWFSACAECGRAATPVASSSTQPDSYTCSNVGCTCPYATLEYRLRLLGSDDTGEAEFTLNGRIAQDIIGISPRQAILNNYKAAFQLLIWLLQLLRLDIHHLN